jgi:hydroxypyruvate isomerase
MMKFTRKQAIKGMLGITLAPFAPISGRSQEKERAGNTLKHSVCRWPYPNYTLEELCKEAATIGLDSVELLDIDQIKVAQKYGLECAIANGSSLHIPKGFNNPVYHSQLLEDYKKLIPEVAERDTKMIICFSGNRQGMDDETGLKNAVEGLKPVLDIAEKHNITVCMELLNSLVDHPDYMCDKTAWGVQLVDQLQSERFRLLYDIYHMQIMEGNIIATIQKYHQYFAHYHTGGVPGRNEIDETQELNYSAIMTAIADTSYKGYIGQEFIPKSEDVFVSLRKAVEVCKK